MNRPNPQAPTVPPPPAVDGVRPFWSVMLPVYNPREDHLREALESVLAQDPGAERMQVEVVDDGSPKVDVAALARAIAGDRVTVSRTPRNLGLAGCWNTCVERARGEWVHVFHQDDRVKPGFYAGLERLTAAHPDAGAAFCRHDYIDLEGRRTTEGLALQAVPGPVEGGAAKLATRNWVQCPAIVVRRSVYEALGGYDAGYSFVLDWEMWLRIGARFPVLYAPETWATFRVQTGSETSRLARTGETVRDAARFIARFPDYLAAPDVAPAQAAARDWNRDLAFKRVNQFLADRHVPWAMAQLRALLAADRRRPVWSRALKLWAKAVLRQKTLVPPPLPFLPDAWFQRAQG